MQNSVLVSTDQTLTIKNVCSAAGPCFPSLCSYHSANAPSSQSAVLGGRWIHGAVTTDHKLISTHVQTQVCSLGPVCPAAVKDCRVLQVHNQTKKKQAELRVWTTSLVRFIVSFSSSFLQIEASFIYNSVDWGMKRNDLYSVDWSPNLWFCPTHQSNRPLVLWTERVKSVLLFLFLSVLVIWTGVVDRIRSPQLLTMADPSEENLTFSCIKFHCFLKPTNPPV